MVVAEVRNFNANQSTNVVKVDGAIHSAAGRTLMKECVPHHGCPTGQSKITGGHALPAEYVIHTVGPIGENKRKLESSYNSILQRVKDFNMRSVAFCCVSTGIYGYPIVPYVFLA